MLQVDITPSLVVVFLAVGAALALVLYIMRKAPQEAHKDAKNKPRQNTHTKPIKPLEGNVGDIEGDAIEIYDNHIDAGPDDIGKRLDRFFADEEQ